jgi:hypothetical protein
MALTVVGFDWFSELLPEKSALSSAAPRNVSFAKLPGNKLPSGVSYLRYSS